MRNANAADAPRYADAIAPVTIAARFNQVNVVLLTLLRPSTYTVAASNINATNNRKR